MFSMQLALQGEQSPFRIMAREAAREMDHNTASRTRELKITVTRILNQLRQTFDAMMEPTPYYDPAMDAIRRQLVGFLSHQRPEFEQVKKQLIDIELEYQDVRVCGAEMSTHRSWHATFCEGRFAARVEVSLAPCKCHPLASLQRDFCVLCHTMPRTNRACATSPFDHGTDLGFEAKGIWHPIYPLAFLSSFIFTFGLSIQARLGVPHTSPG